MLAPVSALRIAVFTSALFLAGCLGFVPIVEEIDHEVVLEQAFAQKTGQLPFVFHHQNAHRGKD